MKKLTTIIVVAIILFCTSCAEKSKGTLIGPCNMSELNTKDQENLSFLWEGDILVNVKMENGDTLHAVMNENRMCERLENNDVDITVIADGEDHDFYIVSE